MDKLLKPSLTMGVVDVATIKPEHVAKAPEAGRCEGPVLVGCVSWDCELTGDLLQGTQASTQEEEGSGRPGSGDGDTVTDSDDAFAAVDQRGARCLALAQAEEEIEEFKKPPLNAMLNTFDFESVAREASVMEPQAWGYYSSGGDDEITLRDNHMAFQRITMRPRILVNVRDRHSDGVACARPRVRTPRGMGSAFDLRRTT
eukprot:Skav235303  [mRNA]  locus=scaffold520:189235:194309:- [translate_table: standard]